MLDRKDQIAGILTNFRAVYKVMVKVAPTLLSELNITYTQMIILGFVKESGEVSLKELASTMGITSSAATQQVNNLVKGGYLVRQEGDVDRRLVKIRLSGEMNKQTEAIEAKFLEQLSAFFVGMTDEELALYCELNSRIANQILQR